MRPFLIIVVGALQGFLKFPDGLSDGLADFRKFFGAEKNDDN